jgi:beta-mannosidase
MARRFFQPVNVMPIPSEDGSLIRFWAVNDLKAAVGLEVEVWALSPSGERRSLANLTSSCSPARAEPLATVESATVPAGHLVLYRWQASNGMRGGEHFAPLPYKTLNLVPAGLTLKAEPERDGATLVTLSAERPAFYVTIGTDAEGRFSDNAIDVLPEEPRSIRFTPKAQGGERPRFRLHDLQSSFDRAGARHEERDHP